MEGKKTLPPKNPTQTLGKKKRWLKEKNLSKKFLHLWSFVSLFYSRFTDKFQIVDNRNLETKCWWSIFSSDSNGCDFNKVLSALGYKLQQKQPVQSLTLS